MLICNAFSFFLNFDFILFVSMANGLSGGLIETTGQGSTRFVSATPASESDALTNRATSSL